MMSAPPARVRHIGTRQGFGGVWRVGTYPSYEHGESDGEGRPGNAQSGGRVRADDERSRRCQSEKTAAVGKEKAPPRWLGKHQGGVQALTSPTFDGGTINYSGARGASARSPTQEMIVDIDAITMATGTSSACTNPSQSDATDRSGEGGRGNIAQ